MKKHNINTHNRTGSKLQKQRVSQKQKHNQSQQPHINQYMSLTHNQKNSLQRRCHTPSLLVYQGKNKSQAKHIKHEDAIRKNIKSTYHRDLSNNYRESKDKDSKQKYNVDKKSVYNSIKNIHKGEPTSYMINLNQLSNNHNNSNKKSPFKHKNKSRQGSNNLNNLRHLKNIQSQLINLSDSMYKNSYYHHDSSLLNQSTSKKNIKKNLEKQHPLILEGKNMMKKHKFAQAVQIFSQYQKKIDMKKQAPSVHVQLQLFYLIGVCHFHLNSYDKVIKYLSQILIKDQNYRKNVYLFLSISYKKLNLMDEAFLVMGKGIKIYPKYVQLILLRAKLLSKQKRYYDSIEDLNKCIKLQPQNIQVYILKADCLRNLTQYHEAIKIYSEVLNKDYSIEILLKRAITFIQSQQIQQALKDLNSIIKQQPKNSQAYLFKGLAYMKKKNYNESILSYQQAIKFNTSKKATTKALYQVAKLKIQTGDFYGASYTLERASSLDIQIKVIDKIKTFTDGATFIMKKKYRRGIELLNLLSKKQHLNQQIKSYLFSFRSYGHFCLNKFASALNDLKQLIKCGFILDNASIYNMTLLEGIIYCQNNQFKQSLQKFTKASQLRPQFGDPQMYKALCKISQYNRTPKLRSKHKHLLQQSLIYIASAIQKQQNFNYFYISALILYILHDYEQSLKHLSQAIERSDEHVMKHFYLRALIRAMQQKYQQAYTDFNNVLSVAKDIKEKQKQKEININCQNQYDQKPHQKQILQVYLNKAKCYLLFGEKKKAFQDLQIYIGQKPLDNQIHLIAGKLLFSIGACEDAVKAYNYSPNVEKNKQTLLSRAKCYMILKQLNLALRDMQKLIDLDDKLITFDYYCLSSLKQASKCQQQNFKSALQKISQAQLLQLKQGHIFKLSDLFFYKGVLFFMLQNYQNAKKFMLKSKNLKKINNQIEIVQFGKEINQILEQEETLEYFDNKIYTSYQIEYNIALCELMLGNEEKAKEVLMRFDKFDKYFNDKSKNNNNNNNNINHNEQLFITPFPTANRLCSIFPDSIFKQQIRFKLSFCLPTINPPPIIFQTQYKLIQQISMTSIQSRPDAPWIKRNKHGVVFTQNMIVLNNNDDVDFRTEKSCIKEQQYQRNKNQQKKNNYQHQNINKYHNIKQTDFQYQDNQDQNMYDEQMKKQYEMHSFQRQVSYIQHDKYNQYHQEQNQQQQKSDFKAQKQRLKNMFLLDNSVQQKLNKIIKKK